MTGPIFRIAKLLLVAASLFVALACGDGWVPNHVSAGEAQWIWSPNYPKEKQPGGTCYFRKVFDLTATELAQVQITADDRFELFVNGRRLGTGKNWRRLESFDIQKLLRNGRNVISVKAENVTGGAPGMVARVIIRRQGDTEISYSTDSSWKTSSQEFPGWEGVNFNDSRWTAAKSLGELGVAKPWGDQILTKDGQQAKRFTTAANFTVERVIGPDPAGTLIAMTFNEWGEILASREKGPLMLIIDKNKDGLLETVTTYCDKVTNCQGILALNGEVFVTGDGPDGAALYRLSDDDQDGEAEKVTSVFGFEKGMSEHGAHALMLGPDGFIYLMIGNHSTLKKSFDANSPHQHYYEGDLLEPKYEDPGGHAVGIKAPSGVVVRTNAEGTSVKLFAGGFRNAYDMAFTKEGDLFTYDSDMEWDIGLPWYRQTRLMHVVAGAEFGSRSGWSPWPGYFLDNLPPTVETGRGSPTGVEVYNHNVFPPQYRNTVFACDWSQGRILAIHLKPDGGTYAAKSEVFVQGRPLNVTDLAVGPDGGLYFCTGGRGTEGGIYRVVWTGAKPEEPKTNLVMQAIRQPQLYSAWGRQKIAAIQEEVGSRWGEALADVAEDTSLRIDDRVRALDLMQLYGPAPTVQVLSRVSQDRHPAIRAKVAYLMGIHRDAKHETRLKQMLKDTDPTVRRVACEAISRGRYEIPAEAMVPLLGDSNRFVAWAASKCLEQRPAEQWQPLVLQAERDRVFVVGSAALLALGADEGTSREIIQRSQKMLDGYLSDDDFIDLLRVIELTFIRGSVPADLRAELRDRLAEEYPAAEYRINRELVRLTSYLQATQVIPRMLEELKGSSPEPEKIHAGLYTRFFKTGWTTPQKLALLQFYEDARATPDVGYSFAGYVENVSRDFCSTFSESDRRRVLADGKRWPSATLSVLATLSDQPSAEIIDRLIELDGELPEVDTAASRRLQTGIVAVLANSGDPKSMAYLREAFEKYPARRLDLAMGLAQSPGGENWQLLIQALPIVEGGAAQEVMMKLATVDKKPNKPEAFRQVILCGLKLGENGGQQAVALLSKWTGKEISPAGAKWDEALSKWQQWFVDEYPDLPPPVLPAETEENKWSYQELLTFLNDEGARGDPVRGETMFEKSQCIKCHRFANRGESIGPDLATVGKRFQKKEILESILFPSQVVSDQYSSKTVTTTAGLTYTGMVGAAGEDAIIVLQSNGAKTTIRKDNIEETVPNKKSAMPEGLLNSLSLEEIADLFAYLLSSSR
jgi:putative membrane-bound dehydrogenase-like protein